MFYVYTCIHVNKNIHEQGCPRGAHGSYPGYGQSTYEASIEREREIYTYMNIYIYICTHTYVCMYVCIQIYIYIYIY